MTCLSFDYISAWKELANPSYQQMPEDIKALLARIGTEFTDVHQQTNLTLPWVADLRECFDRFDSEVLAKASHTISSYGHWNTLKDVTVSGAYWKFTRWADQTLANRYNTLGRRLQVKCGDVIQRCDVCVERGLLRVTGPLQHHRCDWYINGYVATPAQLPEVIAEISRLDTGVPLGGVWRDTKIRGLQNAAYSLAELFLDEPFWRAWLSVPEAYMVDADVLRRAEREGDGQWL